VILSVNDNATVNLTTASQTNLEINADDDSATNAVSGTLNLGVGFNQAGTITIDPSVVNTTDGFDTVNVIATAAVTTGLDLITASTTNINLSGSVAVAVDATTTGATLNASAMTGVLTATQTTGLLSVTGGSGNDILNSTDATNTTAVVSAGAGNDTVDLGVIFLGTATGGDGTDTLNVSAAVSLAGATISGFETIDIQTNNVTLDEAVVNGQGLVIQSTGGAAETITVANILATTDLSNLSFADAFVTMNVDVANRDATLGAGSTFAITGSSAADVIVGGTAADTLLGGAGIDSITGGDGDDYIDGGDGADTTLAGGNGADTILGGAGNDTGVDGGAGDDVIDGGAGNDTLNGGADDDTITGGEGADTIDGDAGSDSIILTESSSAVDTVVVSAVVGTSSDSISVAVAGNNNNVGEDTITGFAFGSDVIKVVATVVVDYVHGTDTEIGTADADVAATGINDDYAVTVGLIDLDGDAVYTGVDDVVLNFTSPNAALTEARFEAALQYDLTLTTGGITVTTGGLADTIASGTGADSITTGAGADVVDFTAAGNALDGDTLVVVDNGAAGTLDATDTLALTASVDQVLDFAAGTDKVDLSAFGLSAVTAAVTTTVATLTDDVTDDTYALVYGTLAGTTLTVTAAGSATHTALFFDADTAGTIDTEVVLLADVITAADLIL